MGKTRQNPRYNVISCRVSDAELAEITSAIGSGTRQEYLLAAVSEKLINDRQAAIDEMIRNCR